MRNWNLLKIIRIVLALLIIVQAIIIQHVALGFIGLLFVVMALLNVRCCTYGKTCHISNKITTNTEEVQFEEIK